MDKRIESLKDWGCDIQGALGRMLDDEEFYLECLEDIVSDPCFEGLKEALIEGDVKKAFDAAHTLKGVLSNVGLTPMFQKTVEIVEPLRQGHGENLLVPMDELMRMKDHLAELLNS